MRPRGVKRLFRFPSRSRVDVRTDVADEFHFHLDMRTADLVRAGLTERDARAQALREFGDQTSGARACVRQGDRIERRRWIARVAGELRQDLLFGLRLIGRSPGFCAIAVLTLGLAIGANTAIFAFVNALLFKPLPVASPETLAAIRAGQSQMSWPNYEDIRARNDVFSDVTAHRRYTAGLATRDMPVRLDGELTAANYFSLLGVPAAVGRTFTPGDGRHDVVVLADRVWRRRFNADPTILGRVLTLDGRPREVIGVMPPRFRGIAPPGLIPDFWTPVDPAASSRAPADRQDVEVEAVARLKPGVTHGQALASMQALARHIRSEHPNVPESFLRMEVFPLVGIGALRGATGTLAPVFAFLVLMTLVSGFVLVIGCANIAGLLMGRAAARRREIAIRLAMGAGRLRLVRQLLTESLLLALIGGAAGVLLAIWLTGGVHLLTSRFGGSVELDLRIDRRVLWYALGLSACTCLIFGLAPARRGVRVDVLTALKADGSTSTARQRLRQALVVGQVAVGSLLLVWGGLFLRSMDRVGDVDPGFDPAGVLLANVSLGQEATADRARGERIFVELQQRVRESPGVRAAGSALVVPLALWSNEAFYVSREGDTGQTRGHRVVGNRLTPGWFDTIRIPLLAGRDFTWADREGSPGVVLVNETLARTFWNGDAVGKRLTRGDRSFEVIGVVRDSKYWTLGETIAPAVYHAFRQDAIYEMTLHVRTADVRTTSEAIRREMQRLAPGVPVDIRLMTDAVSVAVLPARIGAAFTGVFGVVAMLLSAMGVYGLVSFTVVQRIREIGIRKAVGARTADILRLVVGGSAALAAIGLAIGLGIGVLGARVLRGFLTGVTPTDPLTLVAVTVLVLGTAFLASALPALRATRVDPLVTLRDV